ncbi:MAG: type I restriction-modification system subunit M [Christensenellales bacterium]|jgi:type I restriction enzyme M protein|nr:type I restriction-modification system subunit M [Clostridiales bacterium]
MNKQQLASKIWQSANKMRSKIEANEYKDYILGFIFYKFLSDKEVEYLKKTDWTDEDIKEYLNEENIEEVQSIQKNLGYFISYENLFSTWLKKGSDFGVDNVRDALSAFSRLINNSHKKVFDRIFNTLQTGLSKLGESSGAQTKAISELLKLIKDIPMNGKQDYDVLGFIYEYLISNFAANAGKKAGEFYTPHEVSLLMSEIVAHHLKEKDKIEIYDPTSGSGSLLINIGQAVSKHMKDKNRIKYYAQELKENTYNLTRMNLIMRGILPDNIVTRNGDTLEEDWPYFDESDPNRTYNPLYVDAVVSNPPYSQAWDPKDKENDPRYARFGLAPKSKADYAFLLHDLYHIKPDGIMTIVLPHGVLFRGGEEEKIRTSLIENNHIDTIIGLPSNIFFGTGIPTIVMVLKQKRVDTDILIIDASKGFAKEGKNNKLRGCDIKKIVDTWVARKNIDKFSKVVSRDEIRGNEYNLNIPRYVDSSEKAESWDIYASMFGGIPNVELDELAHYWTEFPTLKSALFDSNNDSYATLAVDNVVETIAHNTEVKTFIDRYNASFENFADFLEIELIENMQSVVVSREKEKIAEDIFNRLSFTSLIDKYQAYQLFDDKWKDIAIDIEIMQSEGFQAVKKVDANMVLKNNVEVQDGYVGRIIPFGLIQKTMLVAETASLQELENNLNSVSSEFIEILESFSEEEKEENKDIFNENQDSFVNAELTKYARQLQKDKSMFNEDSPEYRIVTASNLIIKERELKREIKKQSQELLTKSKVAIENLTDTEAISLLKEKWIISLLRELKQMPIVLIEELASKIKRLADKYQTTLLDIELEINKSENELLSLIDELEGDEFDMKGLTQLQKILGGDRND